MSMPVPSENLSVPLRRYLQDCRATVQAAAPSRLWCLTALRYTELANRQPALGLALVTMAGQVLARRASDSRRRVAST